MTPTTEELAAELDELGTHMALGPNQSATLRAAAARLRELHHFMAQARIASDRWADYAKSLTETHSEP